MGELAIAVRGLRKSFGTKQAVAGIDLEIAAGSLAGLVGPNGAGKTTSLSMMTGLLRPDDGRVLIRGLDVWADPPAAKAIIGVVPDQARLFERLSHAGSVPAAHPPARGGTAGRLGRRRLAAGQPARPARGDHRAGQRHLRRVHRGAGLGLANIFTVFAAFPVEKRAGSPAPRASDGYMGYSYASTFGSLLGVAAAVSPVVLGVVFTRSDPAVVRVPVLLLCAAGYGIALAWTGARIAARAAEQRLPGLCQIAVRSKL